MKSIKIFTRMTVRWCSVVMVTAAAAGCATAPGAAIENHDPFERYNRSMYSFNKGVDNAILKPVATAYSDILPPFFQTMVGNFFGNIGDVWTAVNNALQGKPREATTTQSCRCVSSGLILRARSIFITLCSSKMLPVRAWLCAPGAQRQRSAPGRLVRDAGRALCGRVLTRPRSIAQWYARRFSAR